MGETALKSFLLQQTPILPAFACGDGKEFSWIDVWRDPPWVGAEASALKQADLEILTGRVNYSVETCQPLNAERLRMTGIDDSLGCSSKASTRSCEEDLIEEASVAMDCMERKNLSTNNFVHLMQKCINEKDLAAGREVHSKIVKHGLESDSFFGSHLIRMFAFFECLWEANQVFRKIFEPSVFAWSAIISAHAKVGQTEAAIQLYYQMRDSPSKPDGHVFVSILQACASTASLKKGKLIHGHIIERGLESHLFIGNSLIDMYTKCGSLQDARSVFHRLPERDVVTWNVMISGYGQQGQAQEALQLLQKMPEQGTEPNRVTFISYLKACSSCADLEQGRQIHAGILERGFECSVPVADNLIDMYVKCGNLQNAQALFDRLPRQNVKAWNAMIAAYIQHRNSQKALQIFQKVQEEGVLPNIDTFVSVLRACSILSALKEGKMIHSCIIESGFEADLFVGNTLIDLYGKCGSLQDACTVFDRLPNRDVVTWSALIAGYTQHGHGAKALQLFQNMRTDGIDANQVTFVCITKACSIIAALDWGQSIHNLIMASGFELDIFVGSALVDMYTKCGSIEDACMVFERLPKRDVVTWSALILGNVQHDRGQEALQVFKQMQKEGMEPTTVTYVGILKACSYIAALEQGKRIHAHVMQGGFESDNFVGTALIDMYAKCGSLEDAYAVFDSLPKRDIVTWSAMIGSFGQYSNYKLAFQTFEGMQKEGLRPNEVTFICLLSACSHVGLVDEGCLHFKSMVEDHGIVPMLEHYYSMVDLLGYAGHFNEAEDLLEIIPFEPNIVGWTSLLSSCRKHGNVNVGRRCFKHVVTIDPGYSAGYALMSNIYTYAGMWNDAVKVEQLRISANAWKKPAKAFIEVGDEVHDFIVGDKTHPRSDDIYAKLKSLSMQMREEGYLSHISLVLDSVSDEDKEDALCGHSEKLAIAFGLICTPRGTTIRVAKNLRVCAHCHVSTEIISKIEMREIIITDAYRVHYFKDGACSCKDYH